jgi:hypothetical protein
MFWKLVLVKRDEAEAMLEQWHTVGDPTIRDEATVSTANFTFMVPCIINDIIE